MDVSTSLVVVLSLFLRLISCIDADDAGSCGNGHLKLDGACFVFNLVRKTWNQARDICDDNNMHLARIDTKEKHDALNHYLSKVFKYNDLFWIDLRRNGSGFYHTSTNTPLNQSLTFWNPGQPDNQNGNENCVMKQTFGWSDIKCFYKYNPLCESTVCPSECKEDENNTEQPKKAIKVGNCSDGVKKFQDTCYFIEASHNFTRDDADRKCVAKSAALSLMNSDEKYKQVDEYLKTQPFVNWLFYWVQGRRQTGTDYFIDDNGNNLTGTRWNEGEPNNYLQSEDCIVHQYMLDNTTYKWNDISCDRLYGYICELKDCPADCVVDGSGNEDTTTQKSTTNIDEASTTSGSTHKKDVKGETTPTSHVLPTTAVAKSTGSPTEVMVSVSVLLLVLSVVSNKI